MIGFPLLGQNLAFAGFGPTVGPISTAFQQTQAAFATDLLPEPSRTFVFGPSSSSTPAFGPDQTLFRTTSVPSGEYLMYISYLLHRLEDYVFPRSS